MNATGIAVDYIAVSVATLQPHSTPNMDLYHRDADEQFVLYRSKDYPLTEEDLEKLRQRGIRHLYIDGQDRDEYQQYLRELLDPQQSPHADMSARTRALTEVVRDVMSAALSSDDTDELVDEVSRLGTTTAQLVCDDQFAAGDLFRVLHHDYGTFTHSTNVSLYASMLAAKLGHDRTDVQLIAAGGLLHDLGKLSIANRILGKPDRLTDDEFRVIKQHPTRGFEQLCYREDLAWGQLMMVYQHHERIDGKGYPVGIDEDEIHPWAKICAIVDVFEAITSFRPYRSPLPKAHAIEVMKRGNGTQFDPEMLKCWMEITRVCWPS